MRHGLALLAIGAALALPGAVTAPEDSAPFALIELAGAGRTVAADLADLDGDGRSDLLQLVFVGFPPNETRWIRVFRQAAGGELGLQPAEEWPLPPGTSAYDLADVGPEPGEELILLQPDGLAILSLAGPQLRSRQLGVPHPPTLAATEDERGIDRLSIAHFELGPEPWLFVPQPGRTVALSARGELLAELHVGARANYLVPRPGPMVFESEMQAFVDSPRLSVGDVNGDGKADLVASSRHYLRVFLRRAQGTFPLEPDRVLALGRISERDHLRASGSVRVDVRDINGDGLVDVLISHQSGALTDAHTVAAIHLNRLGSWDLTQPDQVFETDGAWTSDQLLDFDGDGKSELVRVQIPFSILELVEMLVTSELDALIAVHQSLSPGTFGTEPWAQKKIGVPLDFDTFSPGGFVPTLQFDLNGDGYRDLLMAGSGDRIEVYLGAAEGALKKRAARMSADSRGRVRAGDLDADGLVDLVLYDPIRPGAPVFVARNTGALPGSRSRPSLRPAERREPE